MDCDVELVYPSTWRGVRIYHAGDAASVDPQARATSDKWLDSPAPSDAASEADTDEELTGAPGPDIHAHLDGESFDARWPGHAEDEYVRQSGPRDALWGAWQAELVFESRQEVRAAFSRTLAVEDQDAITRAAQRRAFLHGAAAPHPAYV